MGEYPCRQARIRGQEARNIPALFQFVSSLNTFRREWTVILHWRSFPESDNYETRFIRRKVDLAKVEEAQRDSHAGPYRGTSLIRKCRPP